MKSRATSPATEFRVMPICVVRTHSGPTPNMNSTFFDRVYGFLNHPARADDSYKGFSLVEVPAGR